MEEAFNFLEGICLTRVINARNETNKVEKKSIVKLIMQQNENIVSIYRIDFKSLSLEGTVKKLFEHYYYVLLVNIATLSITMSNDINTPFIEFCLGKSIERGENLKEKPRRYAMLLLKLSVTKLGVDFESHPEKRGETLANFRSTMTKLVENTWEKSHPIQIIWGLELSFIEISLKLREGQMSDEMGRTLKEMS